MDEKHHAPCAQLLCIATFQCLSLSVHDNIRQRALEFWTHAAWRVQSSALWRHRFWTTSQT